MTTTNFRLFLATAFLIAAVPGPGISLARQPTHG
jgi:threonine/homoserine/homoserine lactone efflux protein